MIWVGPLGETTCAASSSIFCSTEVVTASPGTYNFYVRDVQKTTTTTTLTDDQGNVTSGPTDAVANASTAALRASPATEVGTSRRTMRIA